MIEESQRRPEKDGSCGAGGAYQKSTQLCKRIRPLGLTCRVAAKVVDALLLFPSTGAIRVALGVAFVVGAAGSLPSVVNVTVAIIGMCH